MQKDSAADTKDMDIGEDYLIDLISKKDKKVIGNICRSIGLSARGSSLDMLNRIRTELKDKKKYDSVQKGLGYNRWICNWNMYAWNSLLFEVCNKSRKST